MSVGIEKLAVDGQKQVRYAAVRSQIPYRNNLPVLVEHQNPKPRRVTGSR
jgi:hypothetical protein